jgi:hypothetical protein
MNLEKFFFPLIGQVQDDNLPLSPEASILNLPIQLTDREVILSSSILIFGLIVLSIEVYLFRSTRASSQIILQTFVITLIVISGLFLVTVGLQSQQIAPAFSLYGAIIGYILGKEADSKSGAKKNEDKNHEQDK